MEGVHQTDRPSTVGTVAASAPAQAQACIGGVESDFDGDGDGTGDLAIVDPDATVGSAERAGRVHIAYSDGATQTLSQADVADNDNAAGDRFGYSVDTTDWNRDGCADLIVGVPFEDWSNNTLVEAGVPVYIPGSPSGLDATAAETWAQGSFGTSARAEAGDQFGFSLAAGAMSDGTPYLVAGAPGDAVGSITAPACHAHVEQGTYRCLYTTKREHLEPIPKTQGTVSNKTGGPHRSS